MRVDEPISDEDLAVYSAYVDACAAGDPSLAADCLRGGPVAPDSPQVAHLGELIDLGEDAPSWALARWVRDQAYRWLLHERDPRAEEAVIAVMACCYPEVDLTHPFGLTPTEFGAMLAASDWIVQQLATYEAGGLDDFLGIKIGASLRARCGPVDEWSGHGLSGYRIDGSRDGALLLTDLRDGGRREALDIGARTGRRRGRALLGRLVPIDVAPGWFFESRPLSVDLETAREVARCDGADAWLFALCEARTTGRLRQHFGQVSATPLTSDIEPIDGWGALGPEARDADAAHEPMAPAMQALVDAGLDPLSANNIGVLDVALIAAQVSPDGLGGVGCSVQAVLTDRRTFEAALVHRTRPEHADGWRLLAGVVPEPVRSRCLDLESRSRRGVCH